MQPAAGTDHKALLTDVIKKQIVILGPDITLAKARNVPGLSVSDDGSVTQISGDPQIITQKLVEQFMELSGMIVKKTMEPLLASYTPDGQKPSQIPGMPATPEAAAIIPTPTPQPIGPQPTPTQPVQQQPQLTNEQKK